MHSKGDMLFSIDSEKRLKGKKKPQAFTFSKTFINILEFEVLCHHMASVPEW